MTARASALLRRDPLLVALLFAALVLPVLLGLVPLDRALASVLDLRPFARGLEADVLDDALFRTLGTRMPALHAAWQGGVTIAIVLAAGTMWLVEGALAGAALGRRDLRWSCGRSLGISLLAIVPRVLVAVAASAPLWSRVDTSWSSFRDALLASAALYLVAGASLTVLVDISRGHAIGTDRGLALCFGEAATTMWRRFSTCCKLVGLELGSMLVCVGVVALTRPLGLFHGALWLAGVLALALRAYVIALVVVGSASLTDAASRSG